MALGDVEGDIWTQGEGLEVVKYGTWRRKVWDTRTLSMGLGGVKYWTSGRYVWDTGTRSMGHEIWDTGT